MKRLLFILLLLSSLNAAAMPKVSLSKSGRVILELAESDFGESFLFTSRLLSAEKNGKVYSAGQMKEEPVNVTFTLDGNALVMQRKAPSFDIYVQRPRYKNGIEARFDAIRHKGIIQADVTEYFSGEIPSVWLIPHKEMESDIYIESKITSASSSKGTSTITTSYSYTKHGKFSIAYYLIPASSTLERMPDRSDVGFKTIRFDKFQDGNKLGNADFICRWNLKKGSHIRFAIDSEFPAEWVPYIKEGLEDWNKAFRAAGLGDVVKVIGVRKASECNGAFDNMVRFYADAGEKNAKGQFVANPLTGEIIQGDILWWNGVKDLLCKWRYLQTAASDPAARTLDYPIEILGPMIRYTICHEMGHVLGLNHNMGASFAYPADSLHSVSFTRSYGTAASVMDYARFNHIATSEDVRKGVSLMPARLGPYDYKAISEIYAGKHLEDERYTFFSSLISAAIPDDPSAQSESLSDDILYSSRRGIENCIVLSDSASRWCGMREEIVQQYFRYISLALSNIGGAVHGTPVPVETQKQTLEFVGKALSEADKLIDSEGISPEERKKIAQIISDKKRSIVSDLEGNFLPPRVRKQGLFSYDEYMDIVKSIKNL